MILCVCPNPSIDTLVSITSFSPGKANRIALEQRYPGGKGVHVALAARELGSNVHLLGFWAGPTGEWVRAQCALRNIATRGPAVDGWNRSCLTMRAPQPYNETELLGVGPAIEQKHVNELNDAFTEMLPAVSVVTMSGSWPVGAPESSYADLLQSCTQNNVPAILDCTGKQLERALLEHPFAIHLNRLEAEAAFGTSAPEKAAKQLTQHCKLAVITDGARGAYFAANEQLLHASCRIDSEHSAVGSGDCLVAGIATATARKLPLAETAALACACGAANCLRAELGMLHREDVERLLRQVQIRRLS